MSVKTIPDGLLQRKGELHTARIQEPHELLSLTGNIFNQEGEYNFHLHAVPGDEGKNVVGGHLMSGQVEVTNEIVLLKTDLEIKRLLEESSGLEGMLGDNGKHLGYNSEFMIETVCFYLGDTLIAEETVIHDSSGQAVTAKIVDYVHSRS
ncbi:MAG: DNA-binding protein [Dehalococcoidia bacterium]|nr:DNA-binding protein [Dehalococcoidia bacterium]